MIDSSSIAVFKDAFKKTIVEMQVRTGRVQGGAKELGEADPHAIPDSELARQARAEVSAKDVLGRMEGNVQASQQANNKWLEDQALPLDAQVVLVEQEIAGLGADALDRAKKLAVFEAQKAELQAQAAAFRKRKTALTHAVSGHGPGTEQIGRLVHGRRADEIATDPPPHADVALAGNKHGLDPASAQGYDKVGSYTSNTSGAFTSNQGMLNVVNEAYAQADQVSRYAQSSGSKLADERLITTVKGTGEGIGYNVEVQGMSAQEVGKPLQVDEMQKRFENIQRTDGLKNAKVLLDPAYVDGKRSGWNLQTAFATPEETTSFANSGEVGASLMVKEHEVDQAKTKETKAAEKLADLQAQVKEKRKVLGEAERLIETARTGLSDAKAQAQAHGEAAKQHGAALAALPDDLPDGTELLKRIAALDGSQSAADIKELEDEMETLLDECFEKEDDFSIPTLKPSHEAVQSLCRRATALLTSRGEQLKSLKLAATQTRLMAEREQTRDAQILQLEQDPAYDKLAKEVTAAEKVLADAQDEHKAARKVKHEAEKPEGGGGAASQPGYNPASGTYEASKRPDKPGNLKGMDEDYESLTAHHLYPWNKIREDLNDALAKSDAAALKKLFLFGMVEVDGSFWDELAKPKEARSYSFTSAVNVAAQRICWSPKNVFMGVDGSKRGDDPGEKIDANFTKTGMPTPSAALAELLERQGGLGRDPADPAAARQQLETAGGTTLEATVRAKIELDSGKTLEVAAREKLEAGGETLETAAREKLESIGGMVLEDKVRPTVEAAARADLQADARTSLEAEARLVLVAQAQGQEVTDEMVANAVTPEMIALKVTDENVAAAITGEKIADEVKATIAREVAATIAKDVALMVDKQVGTMIAAEVKARVKAATLAQTLMQNSRKSVDNEAQAYDPADWDTDPAGKKVLRKRPAAPPDMVATFRWATGSLTEFQLEAATILGLTPPQLPELLVRWTTADKSFRDWKALAGVEEPVDDERHKAQLAAQAIKAGEDLKTLIAGADSLISVAGTALLHRYLRDCKTEASLRFAELPRAAAK